MTELKRPERYVQFESIKPELKEITEFYTRKTADYQYKIKQLNEYADALESEISVLKETPKVEVLLDNIPKDLPEVPRLVEDFIKTLKIRGIKPLMDSVTFGEIDFTEEKRDEILHWINEHQEEYMRAWLDGYTVEKEKEYILKHIDLSKNDKEKDWYLSKKITGKLYHSCGEKGRGHKGMIEGQYFTQSEIDELHTGSYEQIAVKVDEVEG